MRIIFLAWRDLAHPRSGGAEVLAQGLARRLAADGHDVTFFSARVAGRPDEETVDGVKHVRRGGRYGVYKEAYRWLQSTRPPYDLLIDHINTIPFFTPLYESARSIVLIPQLARDVWWYEASPFLAMPGFLAEPLYHSLYRNTPAITISVSTQQDLRAFGWRGGIRVIAMPIARRDSTTSKETRPTVLFVGRLTPSKRVEHALDAFRAVQARFPDAQLWVVGAADDQHYELRLQRRASRVGAVQFLGRVDDAERQRRMSAAHVVAVASVREGWGLVVTEANAAGTPAVGYDVAGLRDSIKPGAGVLVPPGDSRALGEAIADLLSDTRRLSLMSARAREDAAQYSWDRTYTEFLQALRELRPSLPP